jgi:hypothetical protein
MKALNPCGMFKSTSLPTSPSDEFLRSRRAMQPSPKDATSTLKFVMLLAKLTWSLIRAITKSWMERSMLTFPNEIVDPYIHVEPIPDSWNFKLKKEVDLTAVLSKELDSTTEEVKFWHTTKNMLILNVSILS